MTEPQEYTTTRIFALPFSADRVMNTRVNATPDPAIAPGPQKPPATPDEFLAQLASALAEYRFNDVDQLVTLADPAPFTLKQIKDSLKLLRRKRRFGAMERLASMFVMSGRRDAVIRRQYAQSLIDQNRIPQALSGLRDDATAFASDLVEGPEIQGLIGRAYKQLYINGGDSQNLANAIATYSINWKLRRGDYRWHGINLVALSQRALNDNVSAPQAVDPKATAREILDDIDGNGASGYWDYATALEASLATGDEAGALAWLKKYVAHPDIDAFELASCLRQLKEVWRVDRLPFAAHIVPVLELELLRREGGSVEPTQFPNGRSAIAFEAVYGSDKYTYFEWFDLLMRCCETVARVVSRTGAPKGSGFLLPGRVLKDGWDDTPLFLTNSHVVSRDPLERTALRTEDALAEFTRLEGRPRVALGEIVYSSPSGQFDVTICRIACPAMKQLFQFTPDAPAIMTKATKPQHAYVIGHPNGGELAVSMYDNNLVEHENQFLRYRSPTDGGNSGSPVCDADLRAFAIHHGALLDRQLNEGIWLKSVKDAL